MHYFDSLEEQEEALSEALGSRGKIK